MPTAPRTALPIPPALVTPAPVNAGIRNASIRDTVTGGTGSAAGVEPADSIHAGERNESYEDAVLGAVIAVTVEELRHEIKALEDLGARARRLFESGRESKFEKLREVLEDPHPRGREVADLQRAPRHRGVPDPPPGRARFLGAHRADPRAAWPGPNARSRWPRFRRPDGARYLVATDAAGRRHQPPVLPTDGELRRALEPGAARTAHGPHPPLRPATRRADRQPHRGRHPRRAVLKVLLEKLEAIRRELRSDKVFDVIGSFSRTPRCANT